MSLGGGILQRWNSVYYVKKKKIGKVSFVSQVVLKQLIKSLVFCVLVSTLVW